MYGYGFDIDEAWIDALQNGVDSTGDIGKTEIVTSDVQFTANGSEIFRANYVIIAVPTPIDQHNEPNLQYVEAAGQMVGRLAQIGTTIILESTVYPGTTREILVPAVETTSGGTCGPDFFVAYSPERATPGDPNHTIQNVVKVVSAQTKEILADVSDLYASIVDANVHLSTP